MEKKILKSLDEHWKEKTDEDKFSIETNTGIACPECGEELHANFTMMLVVSPPQYESWCNGCKWRGHI